jgi:hypothetical protein
MMAKARERRINGHVDSGVGGPASVSVKRETKSIAGEVIDGSKKDAGGSSGTIGQVVSCADIDV